MPSDRVEVLLGHQWAVDTEAREIISGAIKCAAEIRVVGVVEIGMKVGGPTTKEGLITEVITIREVIGIKVMARGDHGTKITNGAVREEIKILADGVTMILVIITNRDIVQAQ